MENGCKYLVRSSINAKNQHPKCGYSHGLLCDPEYRGCVATPEEKQIAAKTIAEEIGAGEGKENAL